MENETKIPIDVQNDIDIVVKALLTGYGDNIKQIILFGSYSNTTYQPDSDIDIAVILNKLPALKDRRKYYRYVPDTEREIDLLFCTENQLNRGEYVYKHIKAGGIKLYE